MLSSYLTNPGLVSRDIGDRDKEQRPLAVFKRLHVGRGEGKQRLIYALERGTVKEARERNSALATRQVDAAWSTRWRTS